MTRDPVTDTLKSDEAAAELDASAVARYLGAHTDFLVRHPDLAARLSMPGPGGSDGVVDFQRYMVDKLRGQIDRMKAQNRAVLAASRTNHNTQNRVHAAVLFLMDAPSFEALIHTIGHDLAVLLDLDVVALLIEAPPGAEPMPDDEPGGLRMVPAGTLSRLLGPQEYVLEAGAQAEEVVFGPRAREVHSQALLRLNVAAQTPPCLLALGSRDPEMFHPGMATELVGFLARVMERCIRGWLTLEPEEG